MLNIVLFGGPGSGKGTQSAKLIDQYSLYHISTGEVLRDHMARGPELGKIAKEFIDKGQLIPDDLMVSILGSVLDSLPEGKSGVVFDGFPRTIPQAEALDRLLSDRGMLLDAVIGLEVPDEELLARMIKRGKETGRADDNPATIKNRLDVYHNQTSPLRDHSMNNGKYIRIDGMGDVDDIFADIAENLEKFTGRKPRTRK